MAFRRYRTPQGAHVTLDESWAGDGLTLLPTEDPYGVDGKPKPPIYPQSVKHKTEHKTVEEKK